MCACFCWSFNDSAVASAFFAMFLLKSCNYDVMCMILFRKKLDGLENDIFFSLFKLFDKAMMLL